MVPNDGPQQAYEPSRPLSRVYVSRWSVQVTLGHGVQPGHRHCTIRIVPVDNILWYNHKRGTGSQTCLESPSSKQLVSRMRKMQEELRKHEGTESSRKITTQADET